MTSPFNVNLALATLSILCFHFALATFHSTEPRNSDRVDGPYFPEDFEVHSPQLHELESDIFSSPLNSNCEGSYDCFGQDSTDDEEVNVQFKDDITSGQESDKSSFEEEEERGQIEKSSRTKRYPEHLDPNQLPFYPFWIRVGECPLSSDGARQHYCPTPSSGGKWVCIDDYQLCDGIKNCPNAEDESGHYCLFYKALKTEVDFLTRTISSLGSSAASTPVEESNQEMMRPKSSRLSWTVDK